MENSFIAVVYSIICFFLTFIILVFRDFNEIYNNANCVFLEINEMPD